MVINMKVLLAGGGTAGHINPAIAIAQQVRSKEPDSKILFAGTPDGIEAELVQKAGFDFTPIEITGFRRRLNFNAVKHNAKTIYRLFTSDIEAKRVIREYQPDIVIGTGGYVSGPVLMAAVKLGVKTMIHEQNAFPGVTNKLLAKKVDRVLLAVKEAKPRFDDSASFEVVGNPIRESVIFQNKQKAREALGIKQDVCILSFGGSLGARGINVAAADLIQWNYQKNKIHHIHGYGRLGKEHFPAMLSKYGLRLEDLVEKKADANLDVREYIDNMNICLAAADLVVCRSGAITLSELEACGKASILIPSPNVTENHQYHNAMVLVNHEAAVLIEEGSYQKDVLLAVLDDLTSHPEKLSQMGKNASKLAILNTAERIYDIICQLI